MNIFNAFDSNQTFLELQREIGGGKISQAYLFLSSYEFTNINFSLLFAKSLICLNQNNQDEHIAKIEKQTHPDLIIYPQEKNISVADAVDIAEKIQLMPLLSNSKIFVLNNFDDATEQAQNKLLKMIEEPPQSVIFILNAKNENKVLQTIKSRVQKKYIAKYKEDELNNILTDILINKKYEFNLGKNTLKNTNNIKKNNINNTNKEFSNNDIKAFCNIAEGQVGKALNLSNNDEYLNNYIFCVNLLKNYKKSTQILDFSTYFNKDNFIELITILNDLFREILLINAGEQNLLNKQSEVEIVAGEFSINAVSQILKLINDAKVKFESNVSVVAISENLLLKILEVKYLCK